MDLAIDTQGWREPAGGLAGTPGEQPEWRALRARFGAAYCARQVLEGDRAAALGQAGGGSFDRECARIVIGYGDQPEAGLATVNPIALGGGKSEADNHAAVAGSITTGDRG